MYIDNKLLITRILSTKFFVKMLVEPMISIDEENTYVEIK